MADASATPQETPKRKRGVGETTIAPIVFSFDPNRPVEDGNNSPRSKVAHKFRGLALDGQDSSGGGVVGGDGDGDGEGDGYGDNPDHGISDDLRRKRQRPDEDMPDASNPEGDKVPQSKERTPPPMPEVAEEAGSAKKSSEGSLQRAYPSVNRLSESKSRGRKKRAGTPPPRLKKKKTAEASEGAGKDDEMEIVDPVRAALTWREDEITIYDPDDADDDGTGINGVGFRPTPALAHARLMKRRQQMAEYKKREEKEARAKRSQRRRGRDPSASPPDKESAQRKVRFMHEAANEGVRFSAVG